MGDLEAYFLIFQPKLLALYIYNVYICSILTLILTTMAIIDSIWLQGARKRLDNVVLYEAMGQTRSRKLRTSISNPRTQAQMTQRIKWSNLVNFYRANASWMKYAFETKKQTQSEYNKFMSVNVTASQIALTKDMASCGAVVAYPYIITQGSLPAIEWNNTVSVAKGNIFLAPNNTMEDYDTVGKFARDLIQYNGAMREGDQLSLIRITQMTNNSTGYPYIIVRKYEVLLDSQSQAALDNFIPTDFFSAEGVEEGNTLNVPKTNRQGGFAVILSRTIGGKTYVSTQSLVIVNNEELIARYGSASAVQEAIASYGSSSDAFLSSTTAEGVTNSPVSLSINYVTVPEGVLTPGSQTATWEDYSTVPVRVFFNDNVPAGSNVSAKISFHNTGFYDGTAVTATGNVVQFTTPAAGQSYLESHIAAILVTINGVDYEIRFASANSYTIEGLE